MVKKDIHLCRYRFSHHGYTIKQKRRKITTFRIKYYEQGEELLSILMSVTNAPFAFYEDNMIDDDHE